MQFNRKVSILFFSLVVVMFGFGIIIPILPFYIDSFGASGSALGFLMSLYAVMQFFFAPMWGNLSDRFGRKPILMLGILGNGISMLIFGLASQLWVLFLARGLAGVLSSATLPTAMAFISDSTSEEERGGGMGVLGAAMGVGMVLGPGLGGWLSGVSLATPFLFSAGVSFVAFLLVWILLPESLPRSQRNLTRSIIQVPQVSLVYNALSGSIGTLFLLAFLISFAMTNFESIFGLFALDRFGYNAQTVGGILTVSGLLSAIVQGFLTGPLIRRYGETRVIKFSLISNAAAFALMLAAFNLATVMITVSLFVLTNAMLRPGVSSLISKKTTLGQGTAMGMNNAFMSLGRIFGPALAGLAYDLNMNFPYISGSLVTLVAFLLSIQFIRSKQFEFTQRPAMD